MSEHEKGEPERDLHDEGSPFEWYDDETLVELCAQLEAAGPGRRLELHKSNGKTWLHVVPADGARALAFAPLNKSHICPPFCP